MDKVDRCLVISLFNDRVSYTVSDLDDTRVSQSVGQSAALLMTCLNVDFTG